MLYKITAIHDHDCLSGHRDKIIGLVGTWKMSGKTMLNGVLYEHGYFSPVKMPKWALVLGGKICFAYITVEPVATQSINRPAWVD